MNILLIFTNVSYQKGSFAQVKSLISIVGTEHKFFLLSHFPEMDKVFSKELNIELVSFNSKLSQVNRARSVLYFLKFGILYLQKKIGLYFAIKNNQVCRVFENADITLDLSGDSYKDFFAGFSPYHNLVLLFAKSFSKPLVLVSQTIGPFRKINRPISRYVLNKVDYIYLRESETYDFLNDLGVKSRNSIEPDLAFSLPLSYNETEKTSFIIQSIQNDFKGKQIVMVSISLLLFEIYGRPYLDKLDYLLSHIDSTFNTLFVLVPHDVKPEWNGRDDRSTIQEYLRMKTGTIEALPVLFDFDPSFIKHIASLSDFGVCARMHAGIALLSSNKPCLFIGWSNKYQGILNQLNQINSEIDLRKNYQNENLSELFDLFLTSYDQNRIELVKYNHLAKSRISRLFKMLLHEKA